MRANQVRIISVDQSALRCFRGKSLIETRSGRHPLGPNLDTIRQLVSGLP
jgi:hypothetical protein